MGRGLGAAVSGAADRTAREKAPDRSARVEAALRAALALDDAEYPALHAALAAARPLSVLEAIFAPAPGFGAPLVVRPDPATAPLAERKRLLVQAWESLPEAERRAFLSRVDPRGVFIRGAS